MGPHFNMGGWRMGWWSRADSLRHCCRRHSGGGKERHQLGGTLPSWCEIKDGSDTGCQNNNGALTVRCVVLLSVCLLCCILFLPFCRFSQTVCYRISSPPPCYIRFLFACVTGTSTRPLHGHVLGGNGAMPKMDGTSTSGPCTPPPLPIQAQGQLQFGSHHDARQLPARRPPVAN